MNDKVLMIHEVLPWMLDLDLSEYKEITFDDGLYSQYNHYKHFKQFGVPLTFFISTNIVQDSNELQSNVVMSCSDAHEQFFETGDKSQYMNWKQIIEIQKYDNCFIGGHSHQHLKYNKKDIRKLHLSLRSDISKMMDCFKMYNIEINKFCFPYNIELPFYRSILQKYNVDKYYGQERIAIEDLK